MRRTIQLVLGLAAAGLSMACDQPTASAPPPDATPASVANAAPPPPPSHTPAPASTWDGSMPPRPVPRTSPTVGAGMPAEVQMQAIAYMAAMGEPRFDDPNADATWAGDLAEKLKPITRGMDRGTPEDKEKLDRVEVASGGRRIDLMMAAGCDADAPMRAVVTRAGQTFATLFGHGVLVVRCNDARVQCLQSTRDPTDVLCTTAPRHR